METTKTARSNICSVLADLLENAYMCVCIILLSASVSSPIVSGGMRSIHENKITSQLGSSTNHHPDNSRHGSSEDYLHMVHRISSEVRNIYVNL